ncbi:ATP-binding protein [Rubellimicrobium aerolatum]|uniref:histidine kinase n=1 Tax=Rubellimicrobium aerolatum TaxID=490979 RepID=A0ABW0S8I3_9RHOB|nr:ATP-binding protein [Rubellimicrobium aerolatum]MBP1804219.1 two-component system osmolarity sensor histidine kinase EnvZ [Rubellimicrobium aerolatum]
MIRQWLHDRMPRSLIARVALILVLPVVTLQLVVSIAFVQRYYEDVTRQMTHALLLELRFLGEAVAAAPDRPTALAYATSIAAPLELDVALPAPAPLAEILPRWDLAGRAMAETLHEGLPDLRAVDLSEPRRVAIQMATPQGDLRVGFSRRRVAATNPHQLLVLTGVLGALTTAVSYLVLRNQVRPIQRLARAATAYGRGRILPFRPSGALEVRAAGTAFLDMRARIERQSQARTAMLAGISHDLRTPLTRLRLGLTLLDDPEAEDLVRDVDDMARMIDAFLDFARGDAGDAPEAARLPPLVREVVEDFRRTGHAVALAPLEGADPGPVPLRPLAIRRALENLIGNALAHGTRARVGLAFGDRSIRLTVEDDGPGIPPDRREEALRPFARLDAARNQDRPGVGLGLAIVADIARTHGGTLRLGESADLGGLRADLVIAR